MPPSDPLRIALVSTEFPPAFGGGIGTCVCIMAAALAERGHEVTVVTPAGAEAGAPGGAEGPGEAAEGGAGVRVVRVGHTPPAADAEPLRTLEAWWSWSAAAAACVAGLDVHIAEFPDYRGEAAAFVAQVGAAGMGGAGGAACVVRLHTPMSVLARFNAARARHAILELLETEAMLGADGVISSSEALTAEVRGDVPGLGPVEFAPYGVDPALLGGPEPAAAGGRDVVYVGRLEERKGVETLARAAAAFLDAAPGAALHFIGADTPYSDDEPSTRRRVEAAVAERHRGRVRFHGALPPGAVRERVMGARLCVFPSLFEAGPYTCLEAMAMGRPVIGGDRGGMAAMIEPGVSGLLFRAGDEGDLARAMISLFATDDAVLGAMGAAGRARVRERYSAAGAAAATEAAYRRVLGRRGARRRGVAGLGAVLASRGGARERAAALESHSAGLWAEVRALAADRDRLAEGWRTQAERIADLDAHITRLWGELRATAGVRDQWHAEAQRLARAWEELAAELRGLSGESTRLAADLNAAQSDRAGLLDRLSRLERSVAAAQRRPVFRVLARAGLLRPIGPARSDGGTA